MSKVSLVNQFAHWLLLACIAVLSSPTQAQDPNLPPILFCDGPSMKSVAVEGGVQYSCATECRASDYCPVRTAEGLVQLNFVTDKMGGHIYYNPIPGAPTLFMHTGGGGTARYEPEVYAPLRTSGLQLVEIEWEKGASVSALAGPTDLGWFTRADGKATNLANLSKRPAAVIHFVHDNIARGQKFGTSGCSGGSLATFFPVYFHGLGAILDYQWIGGGPYYDVGWSCGAGPKEYAWNRAAQKLFLPVDSMVDYVHQTGTTCQKRKDSKAFEGSSMRRSPGTFKIDHAIDISTSYRDIRSDSSLGIYAHAVTVGDLISSPDKTVSVEQGPHCFAHALSSCQKICSAMLGKEDCGCAQVSVKKKKGK